MDTKERVPNMAAYLLLPLVELSKSSFGDMEEFAKTGVLTNDSNFVDCFLTNDNTIMVIVQSMDRVPAEILMDDFYFTDFTTTTNQTAIVFRTSPKFVQDLEKFRQGKYSKFSQIAKDQIAIFNGYDDNHYYMKVLNRDKGLREQLEKKYEIELSDEDEVKSIPSESNFIDLNIVIGGAYEGL
jgi:hypothetical protein